MKVHSTMLMAMLAIGWSIAGCGAGGAPRTDAARDTGKGSGLDASSDSGGVKASSSSAQGGQTGSVDANLGRQDGDENADADRETDGDDSTSPGVETANGKNGPTCPFPSSFRWISSGPLAEPKSPVGHSFVSLKDFTVVKWKDTFVVYASVFDTKSTFSGVSLSFTDWSKMGTVPQTWMESTPAGAAVSPTLMYFTPKNQWVLTFQWGFKYSTSSDPTQPSKWSVPRSLFASRVANSETGPIDQTVICDESKCYLFFTATNGSIYRSSMPIGNFPGTFPAQETLISEGHFDAFEGVQVYAVRGTGKYLMVVEAIGKTGARYFRAYSADSLDGKFTAIPGASSEATPFAGKSNITFPGVAWTNDIGQGDVVREDPSETQTIDPCRMKFLYQGVDPSKASVNQGEIPYRPGLLTLVR